jgi:Bacteriophage head to tail connecting protein
MTVSLNAPDEGVLGGGMTSSRTGKVGPRDEPLKVSLERRKVMLDIDRKSWWANWMDLIAHFRPYRGRLFTQDGSDTNKGWRRNFAIVNSTPLQCINTVSAGLLAGTTSPSRPWFLYELKNKTLMEAAGVKEWLDLATEKGRDILGESNFYNAASECYGEYPVVGIMAMGREWGLTDELPHFQPFTIGSYYIANDKNRRVNVFFRDFTWTVWQIVEKFAIGDLETEGAWRNISDVVKAAWFNRQYEQQIYCVHAVYENPDRMKGSDGEFKANASGMRFRSVYYERGSDPQKILEDSDDAKKTLRIGGFRDFPVFVARWYTNSEDAWGRGPAMDALGDARSLMLQEKREAQAIDKLIDPPMIANPALRNQYHSTLPGDTTFVAPDANSVGFRPVFENFKPDLEAVSRKIAVIEGRIKEVTGANIFTLFIDQDEQKQPVTAAEINAKQQEKLLMLGPVLENETYDFLNPLHQWLFPEMLRRGLLPPPPPALRGQKVNVKYVSILAQSINAVTFGSLQQFSQFVGQVAQISAQGAQNPALDAVDFDDMIREAAKATGIPATVVRDQDEIEQIRQQRAQAQQAQQQQEAQAAQAQTMNQHAQTAQTMSQTPAPGGGSGSLLDNLAQSVGAGAVH